MDLYEYDVATGHSKLVWKAHGTVAFGTVSHDHHRIALVETLSDRNSNLYVLAGDTERLLTRHEGDVLYAPADFARDGRTLLYASDEGREFAALHAVDVESGERRPVLQTEWDVEAAGYSPGFRYQFTQVNADGAPRLDLRDAGGRPVELPAPPRGGSWSLLQIYRYGNQPRFSRTERYVGVNVFGGATPAVPYVVDLKTGTARPVAEVLPSALRDRGMIAPESVRVTSFDGRQVPAFLYAPTRGAKAPAVILVHGGPTAQSLQRFDPYVQYLASKGYVVLVPNVRGSTGYGKSYTLLDNKDFGGGPLKDVVACKQWLVQNAGVDADRVVVMGGSYGGYMALAAATFTPREFAANVDWFGVSDLKTLVESFPPYWAAGIEFIYAKFGNPNDPKDAPYLHDRSPIWFADLHRAAAHGRPGRQGRPRAARPVGSHRRGASEEGRPRALPHPEGRGARVLAEREPPRRVRRDGPVPRPLPARRRLRGDREAGAVASPPRDPPEAGAPRGSRGRRRAPPAKVGSGRAGRG